MTGPEQPFGGREYPPLEKSPWLPDPYAPVDYPTDAGLPPPVYSPAYPGQSGYQGAPGYPHNPSGYPYPPISYDPYRPMKPPGTSGLAIASLVTSLVSLMFCGLTSIVGVILGAIAIRETKRTGQDGFGLALAGVIVGSLQVLLWVLYLVILIGIAASGGFTYGP